MFGTRRILIAAVAVLLGAGASARSELIYADSLTSGETSSWTTTHGEWAWTTEGLTNAAAGENRIFLDVLSDVTEYEVSLAATLDAGNGWGLFFGADLDGADRVSGFGFQYDPGYGGGAYLLRKWQSNSESVLASQFAELDLHVEHDFALMIAPNSFRVYQDDVEVLSYDQELAPVGPLLGLRTWSTSDATFSDFAVSSVPEPASMVLMMAGVIVAFRGRRLA